MNEIKGLYSVHAKILFCCLKIRLAISYIRKFKLKKCYMTCLQRRLVY